MPAPLPDAMNDAKARSTLRCANPFCKFLVHIEPKMGGYCCKKCHSVSASTADHGKQCSRQEAPKDALVANPTPPDDPMTQSGGVASGSQASEQPTSKSSAHTPKGNPSRDGLQCANERCDFLVSKDANMGGYCCKKCHCQHKYDPSGKPDHGKLCKGEKAPTGSKRAKDDPPESPMTDPKASKTSKSNSSYSASKAWNSGSGSRRDEGSWASAQSSTRKESYADKIFGETERQAERIIEEKAVRRVFIRSVHKGVDQAKAVTNSDSTCSDFVQPWITATMNGFKEEYSDFNKQIRKVDASNFFIKVSQRCHFPEELCLGKVSDREIEKAVENAIDECYGSRREEDAGRKRRKIDSSVAGNAAARSNEREDSSKGKAKFGFAENNSPLRVDKKEDAHASRVPRTPENTASSASTASNAAVLASTSKTTVRIKGFVKFAELNGQWARVAEICEDGRCHLELVNAEKGWPTEIRFVKPHNFEVIDKPFGKKDRMPQIAG